MTSHPVALDILHFFPATLELATLATVIGVLVGVPAGVAAGALKGRWPDHLVRFLGLFGYSMPVFWLGLVGLWLFYAKLDWVAGPGRIDVGFEDLVEPRTGCCWSMRRWRATGTCSTTRSPTSPCPPRCSATSRSPTSPA